MASEELLQELVEGADGAAVEAFAEAYLHRLSSDGSDRISDEALQELLTIDEEQLRAELEQVKEHLATFGDRLPDEIRHQFEALEGRLQA